MRIAVLGAVRSERGDFEAHPPATDDPNEIGPVDFVFLGLKANSYASAVGAEP
jgi:2-dehydropantoate 2-reductase